MQLTTQLVTEAFNVLIKLHEVEQEKEAHLKNKAKFVDTKLTLVSTLGEIMYLGHLKKLEIEIETHIKQLDALIHKIENP